MTVIVKSFGEIELMRRAGQLAAVILAELRAASRPGITTKELDRLAARMLRSYGGKPAFLGYRGYPATICASVNDEVLHGIPGRRVLREGDLVKIDIGVEVAGLFADAAVSFVVGEGEPLVERLVSVTEQAFWAGVEKAWSGNRIGDIGAAIEDVVRRNGFTIVEGFAGLGIGRSLHENPTVPNVGPAGRGLLLRSGMTLAIEPMVSAGTGQTRVKKDGWTVVTEDGSLAAHYEHTVLVSEEGPVILTTL